MKLLTVTVPCYNSQDYMENCIESLLVGGERVEIIIIDDGSHDRTGAIADAYARRYPSIVRVIHQENGGHGEGINQGLAHASGTYFKVVDSDDTLSADFPAFLDTLEACERAGGVDLVVTNYFYVHSDGVGDRSIDYRNALPQERIFAWKDTKRFYLHQMLTIHSCTFRTQVMRASGENLPKHVFYEDNLMVCKTLPNVRNLYYFPRDLYRYWIGRPDQSVQATQMSKRYSHQILVTERCFSSFRFDAISEPRLRTYLKHEMYMMFAISILFTRLNRSQETDAAIDAMWLACAQHDRTWCDHFHHRTTLRFLCMRGKFGQNFTNLIYRIANKVVRFN